MSDDFWISFTRLATKTGWLDGSVNTQLRTAWLSVHKHFLYSGSFTCFTT